MAPSRRRIPQMSPSKSWLPWSTMPTRLRGRWRSAVEPGLGRLRREVLACSRSRRRARTGGRCPRPTPTATSPNVSKLFGIAASTLTCSYVRCPEPTPRKPTPFSLLGVTWTVDRLAVAHDGEGGLGSPVVHDRALELVPARDLLAVDRRRTGRRAAGRRRTPRCPPRPAGSWCSARCTAGPSPRRRRRTAATRAAG